jgi:tripartite-type tricarboxylate transporter receptor subunit TctC
MMNKRHFIVGILVSLMLLGAAALPILGHAADYPKRPIQLICPWGAGGGTDRISRMVAVLLEQELGQPVNVVNRTGGSGATGHTAGATARPDGYTITMITVEITMMHWLGLAQVTYKDYKPVSLLNIDPAGINVRADAEWKTVPDLQDYVKAHPGELKASGTGKGGIWDLARAGWLKAAGLGVNAVRWVPSRGAAPALQELVAGGIDVVTCSIPEAAPLAEAGKVRHLAIMADERDPVFPDVPTLKEFGIDWSVGAWRGIGVPEKTPDSVVAVLEKALSKIVASEKFKDFMKKNGFGVLYKNAADFAKFLADMDASNGKIMKEAGII